jgi:hypothetical protein
MDTACWEIKWEHRDDCVTALMVSECYTIYFSDLFFLTKVLRRIPYLSVSWAHNSQTQQGDHHYQLPGYQGTSEHIPRTMTSARRFQPYDSSSATPLASPDRVTADKRLQDQDFDKNGPTMHNPGIGFNIDVTRNWKNPVISSSVSKEASDIADASVPEAMDKQFDPLFVGKTDSTSFTQSDYDPKLGWDTWEDSGQFEKELAYVNFNFEASDFLTQQASRPSVVASQSPPEALSLQRLEISSRPVPADEIATPGLVMSPSTPRTALPHTPVTPINQAHNGVLFVHKLDREYGNDREYDPTSLFVGGLEICGPEAWTVGKLHSLFARFDGLLDVKMVRPRESLEIFRRLSADH